MLFLRFVRSFEFRTIKFVTPLCGLDEAKCFPSNGHTLRFCVGGSDRKAVNLNVDTNFPIYLAPRPYKIMRTVVHERWRLHPRKSWPLQIENSHVDSCIHICSSIQLAVIHSVAG